jgi:two-component system invasion response regulator UvrY
MLDGATPVIRILIVDDHPVVRNGLKQLLVHQLPNADCGEASDAEQACAKVQSQQWELVILDITLPGRSGLGALADIKRIAPKLPILVLSMHSEDQYGKRVLKAGASGFMNKESAPEELIRAIQRVLSGGRYVSASLAEKLAAEIGDENPSRPAHEVLSDREFEVLRMIGSGKSIGQIADQLHLSGTTVSTYRARILEKMNMTTTAELMHYAMSNDLFR